MARKRLGEVLLQQGAVSRAQLEQALALQRQTRQRLGELLVERGILTESKLVKALGEALGMPVLELRGIRPDRSALKLLKASFCETNTVFPCGFETQGGRRRLVVAVSDPLNLPMLEEVEFLTGHTLSPRLSPASQVRDAIGQHYHGMAPMAASAEGEEFVIMRGVATEQAVQPRQEGAPPVRRQAPGAPVRAGTEPQSSVTGDLAYLLGADADAEDLHHLKHSFWTLMRLLVKKGLISQEEFNAALEKETP